MAKVLLKNLCFPNKNYSWTDPDDDQVQMMPSRIISPKCQFGCPARLNNSNISISAELEVLSHVGHADSGSISTQPIKDFAGVNSSFWTKQRLENSQLNQPQG